MTMSAPAEAPVVQPKKKARIAPEPAKPINANEVINFHFFPDSDSVFDDEEILGYTGLRIDVALPTDTYVPRLFHTFAAKTSPANDYVAALGGVFPLGLPDGGAAFDAARAAAPPLAAAVANCSALRTVYEGRTKDGADVAVMHIPAADVSPDIAALHDRLQPLLIFYVDCAEVLKREDDDRLHLLFAFKMQAGRPVAVLGFMTLFQFYGFPDLKRLRVSQLLVMPPFQRQGVGRALLEAVYKMAEDDAACIDVPFEDPADELQTLRERVDAERAARLPAVWDAAQRCVRAALSAASCEASPLENVSPDSVNAVVAALAVPPEVRSELTRRCKLFAGQVPLVWEVLLWAASRRCNLCSQDAIAGLLLEAVKRRELASLKINGAAEGVQCPSNKHFKDFESDEEDADAGSGGEDDADEEEEAEAEGEDAAAAKDGGVLKMVLYRKDGGRKRRVVGAPQLREEQMQSLLEVAEERVEMIEMTALGMRWPQ